MVVPPGERIQTGLSHGQRPSTYVVLQDQLSIPDTLDSSAYLNVQPPGSLLPISQATAHGKQAASNQEVFSIQYSVCFIDYT